MNGARQLDEHPEAVKQAAVADRLLISKTDLADINTSAGLRARLEELNPGARSSRWCRAISIRPCCSIQARSIPPARATGCGHGSTPKPTTMRTITHHHHDRSRHDAHIGSFCLTFDEPLDWDRFNRWLMAVRAVWGDRLLRVKGVLDVVGESQPLVIHGVHRTFHPPTLLARWPDERPPLAAGVHHPRPRPRDRRGKLGGDGGGLTTLSENRQTSAARITIVASPHRRTGDGNAAKVKSP